MDDQQAWYLLVIHVSIHTSLRPINKKFLTSSTIDIVTSSG